VTLEIEVRSSGPGPKTRLVRHATGGAAWISDWLSERLRQLQRPGSFWAKDGVAIVIRRTERSN
jgi:hypothetical protein